MAFPGFNSNYNAIPVYQQNTANRFRFAGTNTYAFQNVDDPFQGGNRFIGEGNNFLSPNYIAREVGDFVSTFDSRPLIFNEYPDAENIQEGTDDALSRIFNTNFTPQAASYQLPYYPGNYSSGYLPQQSFSPQPGFTPTADYGQGFPPQGYGYQQQPAFNDRGLFSDFPNANGVLLDTNSYGNAIVGRNSPFNMPVAWQQTSNGITVPFHPDNPIFATQPFFGVPNFGQQYYGF